MTLKNNLKISTFLILFAFIPIIKAFSQNSLPIVNTDRPRVMVNKTRFNLLKSYYANSDNAPYRFNGLYEKIKHGDTSSNFFNILICSKIVATDENVNVPDNTECYLGTYKNYDVTGNKFNTFIQNKWKWAWYKQNDNQILGDTKLRLKAILLYYHLNIKEKELQIKRINFIANKFIDYLNEEIWYGQSILNYCPVDQYNDRKHENTLRGLAEFGAILYDWGFDAINTDTRKILAEKLYDLSFHFMKIYSYHGDKNTDPENCMNFPNDNYFGGHKQSNDFYNFMLVLSLYNSSDFEGEEGETKRNNVAIRYRFLWNKFENEFLKIMKFYQSKYSENEMPNISNEVVSGEYNGGAYSMFWYNFLGYFELLYRSTNRNLYRENPWVNCFINQYSALVRPDKSTIHKGDNILELKKERNSKEPYNYEKNILTLYNHFYQNEKNQYMLLEFINKSNIYNGPIDQLLHLNNLGNANYPNGSDKNQDNTTPLDWFSVKSGLSIMNSSKNTNATMVSYISKTINQNNHQHLDNNSFTIFKNGPLFIDSGTYDWFGSEHFNNYYRRSIAHNLITIHDNNEIITDSYSNDGGQIYNYTIKNYLDVENSYTPNVWKTYSNSQNGDYIYHVTDASKSYHQNKVTSYIRKFLYLKNLDRVIVADYVKQPNKTEQFDVRWNAHFKNKPLVFKSPYGEDLVINNGIKIERYSENNKFKIDNGTGGNATIKTLFPPMGALQAKLIGSTSTDPHDGCYYIYGENDTEGVNYQPSTNKHKTDGAKWRLEISQTGKPQHSVFINTIDIGDNNNVSDNTSELVSNVIHPSGLSGSTTIGWENNLYTLATEFYGNPVEKHLINTNKLIENKEYKLLAFDLKPNHQYCLDVNYRTLIKETNAQGILSFTFKLNDRDKSRTLQIYSCPNNNLIRSKKESSDDDLFKIYPNSVRHGGDLTISSSKNTNNTINIYDLTGKLVLTRSYKGNSITLKNLKLSTGVYILQQENTSGKKTKKLIIK